MLGIIVAMKKEAAEIVAAFEDLKILNHRGIDFYEGKLKGVPAVVALSGVGKVNAAYATTMLIELFNPDFVINTGIAGGLGVLPTLSVLVADAVVQHDMDTSPLGDEKGFISGINKIRIDCSQTLLFALKIANKEAVGGIIASGDQFVADSAKAKAIAEAFGAVACDMESGAVGQVCALAGVRFAVLRVISDGAGDDASMTYEELAERACTINSTSIISAVSLISQI